MTITKLSLDWAPCWQESAPIRWSAIGNSGRRTTSPFPLIADPTKQIAKLYDVRRRFGLGTSRSTYVVDQEGVIQGVFHNELDIASHVRQVLATLRRLQG